jgi:hypothetical protein
MQGTLFSGFHSGAPFVKEVIQFEFSAEQLIRFYTHDHKIALPIFSDIYRFTAFMAERGYFIVTVSQIGAGLNNRHDLNPPLLKSKDIIPEFL